MLCKNALPAAAFLGFLLSAPGAAHADSIADAKAAVQSALNFDNDSFVHKNMAGSLATYTDDYTDVGGAKTHTMQDLRTALSAIFAVAKDLSSSTTITDFALHGKEAEVTTHDISSYVIVNTATLQDIKYSSDDTNRTFWVQQGGLWKEKRSRTLTHQEAQSVVAPVMGASASIVGKWFATIPGPGGKPVQWTIAYLPDGTGYQQLIYATGQTVNIQSTYTAQNNVLTQTLRKGNINGEAAGIPDKPVSLNYKLDGDTLTLSVPTSRIPLVFARVKAAQ